MSARIKSGTLYVGNLPIDATRTEVELVCGEIGPIKKCFVLKGKNGQSAYAFVTYALPEDTDTASAELQGSSVRGNQLTISVSTRKLKARDREKQISDASESSPPDRKSGKELKKSGNKEVEAPAEVAQDKKEGGKPAKKQKTGNGEVLKRNQEKKPNSKKGRLIVRNLSFKATEDSLRKHFASVGLVTEVKLLRKPTGLLIGCGFVQFKHEKHAQLAIAKLNTKPFLDRPIIIDWAVEKSRYEAANVNTSQQKGRKRSLEEDEEEEDDEAGQGSSHISFDNQDVSDEEEVGDVKEVEGGSEAESAENEANDDDEGDESASEVDDGDGEASEEAGDDESDESAAEVDDGGGEQSEDNDDERSDADEEEESGEEDADSGEGDEGSSAPNQNQKTGKPHRQSDVEEGTTLFIKNLSFDTDEEALRELFSQYGTLKYAVLCMDPLTEHPRGTAFVQFKSAEDAEKALQAASDPGNVDQFTLDDRRMEVMQAVARDEIQRRHQLIKDKALDGKDKRNLYLAREGLVREGSRAAEGVSRADINKRVGLEKWKMRMLKNFNMFVSQTRLCIHNIPPDMEDSRLRDIFKQHVPNATITEARIMRDRQDVSKHPGGQSKEYGFVTFTEHEHSLAALRGINNNPDVFKPTRRPIVEFAVENRTALEARRKREEKSRHMNAPAQPAASGSRRKRGKSQLKDASQQQQQQQQQRSGRGSEVRARLAPGPLRPAHAGMAADPTNKVLPRLKQRPGQMEKAKAITRKMLKQGNKSRPRERAGHRKDMVEDTPLLADNKKKNTRREKKKEVQDKDRREDSNFSSLVDKYRQKLTAAPATGSRWFD